MSMQDDLWVCPGDSVQITATGTGTFNWSPSVGLNNTAISNPMASPSDTTQYVVTTPMYQHVLI